MLYEVITVFRGRVVDLGEKTMMIEVAGEEDKIDAFVNLMRPYGILEMVRTGRIAMARGE